MENTGAKFNECKTLSEAVAAVYNILEGQSKQWLLCIDGWRILLIADRWAVTNP
jgi:hypothetical protein